MKLNEKKTINMTKDDAYGEVNETLIQEVKKTDLPCLLYTSDAADE